MESYKVYMHNLPKVSEDGKQSLPIEPHGTPQEFTDADGANKCAAENKSKYDRVIVIKDDDRKQEKVERYIDGNNEIQA